MIYHMIYVSSFVYWSVSIEIGSTASALLEIAIEIMIREIASERSS